MFLRTHHFIWYFVKFVLLYVEEFRLDQDPEISSHHLTFKWNLERDCLQIRDEKSFNGTALNLRIIKPGVFYDVHDNSLLNVGKSQFTIAIKDKLEETKKEASHEKSRIYLVVIKRLLLSNLLQGYFCDE